MVICNLIGSGIKITMKMPITNKTKLAKANTSKSLRTTVPAHIIQQLGLADGDVVTWVLQPKNNKFVVLLEFE